MGAAQRDDLCFAIRLVKIHTGSGRLVVTGWVIKLGDWGKEEIKTEVCDYWVKIPIVLISVVIFSEKEELWLFFLCIFAF